MTQTGLTILGFLLGGGFLTFVQYLINRHDQKHDKNAEIVKSINTLSDRIGKLEATMEERDAVQARTHILRFMDELHEGMRHSRDYFEQILDDIHSYNRYCEKHPDFANGRTKTAAEFIAREYDRLFAAHKI